MLSVIDMNSFSLENITVTNVVSTIRLLNSPINTKLVRSNRERWAIALKREGKTFYSVNGKEILSDKTHPVILPKGSCYSLKCIEAGECILFEFDATDSFDEIIQFNISDNSYLINTFIKIEKLLNTQSHSHQLECKLLLYGALNFLNKSLEKEYLPKEKYNLLKPAADYIAENYYKSISNDFLAELCSISTVYFRKTFEKAYGISPIKYLHNIRINKAKSILLSDYESISQVAESVGYNSIYNFSKMFKQYTGKGPTEYKKTSRK